MPYSQKIKWIYFTILLPISSFSISQDVSLPINRADSIISVSHDSKGGIFLSTQEGKIIKCAQNGEKLLEHTDEFYQPFTTIEARYGLYIFAFQKESQQIHFFDRFLNLKSTLELEQFTDREVVAATISSDNLIWVYTSWNEIKKIDYRYQQEIFSGRTSDLVNPPSQTIVGIYEHQAKVYLLDAEKGIYIFDNQLNIKHFIPKQSTSISFENNNLLFISSLDLCRFNEHHSIICEEGHLDDGVTFIMSIESKLVFINSETNTLSASPKE